MSRILIADDTPVNRYFLETLLGSNGHQVVSSANGEQALDLARKDPPDLIITDILMPVLDGFQLCRIWKSDDQLKAIPFIFYTATYTEPKDERFALSLGADRFLVKPQEPAALMAVIQEFLGKADASPRVPTSSPLGSEMEYLRQYNEALFNKLEKKVRDLQASQQLAHNLMENAPALIYIVDSEGRFVQVNRHMECSMKHPAGELLGKTRDLFLPADVAAQFRANDQRVLATGEPLTFEEVGREDDGEHIYLTVKFPMQDEEGRNYAVCGISADITELKRLEKDLQKLNDLQVMLYQMNRAIRSTGSEAELFEAACRICIDHGKFDLAWVGWKPSPGESLRADFWAGPLVGYVKDLEIPTDPLLPEAEGPSATCLREGRAIVCQDWTTDPKIAPWRDRSSPYGIRSSAALPIFLERRVLAVLNLYSVQPQFFTQDRLNLLQELNHDLSYAIRSLVQARHREEAEKALVARELEYRAAFEQGSVGMAQISVEGNFLKVNHCLCDLFGYGFDELVGRHVNELTHPDDRDVTLDLLRSLGAGHQDAYQLQKRYLRKDGQDIWVDLSGAVVRHPDGRVMYYLSSFSDITQRKKDEQRLQEERSKLQGLLRTIPDLVWLKDLEGMYQYCNPRFETYCGMPQEQLIGRTDHDFAERAQADRLTGCDLRDLESGGQVQDEVRVAFADGHEELLEVVKTLVRDPAGRPIGILGIARDVTRNRMDQERLRKLSNAIEHSPIVVVITDRDGTIEHVNPRFTELTGYTLQDAIGGNPRLLKSGMTPVSVYEELWGTILAGRIWHGEIQNRKKSGEFYWESTSISPIFDDGGNITHFVALKEDITELKRIQTELQDQIHELRRWHEATLGRETRVLGLKREVNELLSRLGEPLRYASAESDETVESRP